MRQTLLSYWSADVPLSSPLQPSFWAPHIPAPVFGVFAALGSEDVRNVSGPRCPLRARRALFLFFFFCFLLQHRYCLEHTTSTLCKFWRSLGYVPGVGYSRASFLTAVSSDYGAFFFFFRISGSHCSLVTLKNLILIESMAVLQLRCRMLKAHCCNCSMGESVW